MFVILILQIYTFLQGRNFPLVYKFYTNLPTDSFLFKESTLLLKISIFYTFSKIN